MIHCHLKMSVIISHKHTFYFIDTLLNNLILVVYLMQEITVIFLFQNLQLRFRDYGWEVLSPRIKTFTVQHRH